MKIRVLAMCAAALLMPFVAACSDDDSGKRSPNGNDVTVGGSTVDELSEQLQNSGVSEDAADCLASAYGKLDLTEAQMERLQAGDPSALTGSDMKAYLEAASECLGGGEIDLPN